MDSFDAKVAELSPEDLNAALWSIYGNWNNSTAPKEVDGKRTWPLPFTGPSSIESLLQSVGWGTADVAAIEEELFHSGRAGVQRRPGCSHSSVTWPDVQAVFRETLVEALGRTGWSDALDETYPPLHRKVRLSLRVERHDLQGLLVGEWRMFCKPPTDREGFSYGLVVTSFDEDSLRFEASPVIKGRWELREGKVRYENDQGEQHAYITYQEVWGNGFVDHILARLKSNGKFQCESGKQYVQKARREDTMSSSHRDVGEIKYWREEPPLQETEPDDEGYTEKEEPTAGVGGHHVVVRRFVRQEMTSWDPVPVPRNFQDPVLTLF